MDQSPWNENIGNPLAKLCAARALVSIGSPAAKAIAMGDVPNPSERRFKICAYVVYLIDGEAVGRYRIESMVAELEQAAGVDGNAVAVSASLSSRRDIVRELLRVYQKCRFKDANDWPN
jgi:hypothetical protein